MLTGTHELAARLERAFAERMIGFARAARAAGESRVEVLEAAGGCATFIEPGHPVNRASGLGMSGEVTPEAIDGVESFFRTRGEPTRLELCPFADSSLIRLIGDRGYRLRGFITIHAVRLADLSTRESASEGQPGLSVERVNNVTLEEFTVVLSRGFHDGVDPEPLYRRIPRVNYITAGTACFLARVDGRAAGAGSVGVVSDTHGTIACLFGAATEPWARRRGVQRALLAARLALARDAGCDLAAVMAQTGSASDRNMARAGFMPVYTRTSVEAPEATAARQ
ncbi:MAG: GNAT family N-acetyltransferase [Phycisphaerales bacterium]